MTRSHSLLLLGGLCLAPLRLWCQAPTLEQQTLFRVFFYRVEFGELVGAQYLPEQNRFLLYATRDGPESILYRDHVVQLASAALLVGDFGFSLDFVRSGTAPFKATDVLLCGRLAETLKTSDHPFARSLRERFGRGMDLEALSQADAAKPPKAHLNQIVSMLNRARQMRDLWTLLTPADLTPETAAMLDQSGRDPETRKRLGRLVLEDFFSPALRRDIADQYVIAYKPSDNEALIKKLMSGTRTESTLLRSDTWLKRLGGGDHVPPDLVYGPSELSLCTTEIRDAVHLGTSIKLGEYLNFFTLDVEYNSGGFPGMGLWFGNPKIVVKAGAPGSTPVPICAERFSASLSRHMANLIRQTGELGSDIRMLKALLVLNRAMSFMASVVPVDVRRIRSIPSDQFNNEPPKVIEVPVYFAEYGKTHGFAISGGVQLAGLDRNDHLTAPPEAVAAASTQTKTAVHRPADDPGFIVTSVKIDGRQLLEIDISSILGLEPKP